RPALRDRQDQSARRGRREKRVAKAQSDRPASADHQVRKAPLAHSAPPDQLARRVTPAWHRQIAESLGRIAFAAETTRSWLVLFARAVRPTERSARPLAWQQLVYVYVGDLGHRVATTSHIQQVLGWLGGGLVVAATGRWAGFVYFSWEISRRQTVVDCHWPRRGSTPARRANEQSETSTP